ncbi:MLP-like protein 31 [Senna tora]|uniref:MLP-like protein 31 n=1 Tax=Senna tora TaxID=362788 RepID=A0A834STW4_9FABA|nr:MLP-like protein 31 [Senna tora]
MSLVSKLEADIELKASALSFLEIFSTKPYEIANIDPSFIQSVQILSGQWGVIGFVVLVNYTLDGKASVAKMEVEDLNLIDISITFNVVEGDLLEEYKSIKFIIKVTPKILQLGSEVHWTIQYEKLNDQIPDPNLLMQDIIEMSKMIDASLTNLL